MLTIQQRTAARLLHRVVEVALSPPSKKPMASWGLVDVLVDRVLHALPSSSDATLMLREAEAEWEDFSHRRYFDPCIRRFDPYQELFAFRHIMMRP